MGRKNKGNPDKNSENGVTPKRSRKGEKEKKDEEPIIPLDRQMTGVKFTSAGVVDFIDEEVITPRVFDRTKRNVNAEQNVANLSFMENVQVSDDNEEKEEDEETEEVEKKLEPNGILEEKEETQNNSVKGNNAENSNTPNNDSNNVNEKVVDTSPLKKECDRSFMYSMDETPKKFNMYVVEREYESTTKKYKTPSEFDMLKPDKNLIGNKCITINNYVSPPKYFRNHVCQSKFPLSGEVEPNAMEYADFQGLFKNKICLLTEQEFRESTENSKLKAKSTEEYLRMQTEQHIKWPLNANENEEANDMNQTPKRCSTFAVNGRDSNSSTTSNNGSCKSPNKKKTTATKTFSTKRLLEALNIATSTPSTSNASKNTDSNNKGSIKKNENERKKKSKTEDTLIDFEMKPVHKSEKNNVIRKITLMKIEKIEKKEEKKEETKNEEVKNEEISKQEEETKTKEAINKKEEVNTTEEINKNEEINDKTEINKSKVMNKGRVMNTGGNPDYKGDDDDDDDDDNDKKGKGNPKGMNNDNDEMKKKKNNDEEEEKKKNENIKKEKEEEVKKEEVKKEEEVKTEEEEKKKEEELKKEKLKEEEKKVEIFVESLCMDDLILYRFNALPTEFKPYSEHLDDLFKDKECGTANKILQTYNALILVISRRVKLSQPIYFRLIRKEMNHLLGRITFDEEGLRQVAWLAPQLIILNRVVVKEDVLLANVEAYPEYQNGKAVEDIEIRENVESNQDLLNCSSKDKKEMFQRIIINWANVKHNEFLRKLNEDYYMPLYFELKRWHSKFNFKEIVYPLASVENDKTMADLSFTPHESNTDDFFVQNDSPLKTLDTQLQIEKNGFTREIERDQTRTPLGKNRRRSNGPLSFASAMSMNTGTTPKNATPKKETKNMEKIRQTANQKRAINEIKEELEGEELNLLTEKKYWEKAKWIGEILHDTFVVEGTHTVIDLNTFARKIADKYKSNKTFEMDDKKIMEIIETLSAYIPDIKIKPGLTDKNKKNLAVQSKKNLAVFIDPIARKAEVISKRYNKLKSEKEDRMNTLWKEKNVSIELTENIKKYLLNPGMTLDKII